MNIVKPLTPPKNVDLLRRNFVRSRAWDACSSLKDAFAKPMRCSLPSSQNLRKVLIHKTCKRQRLCLMNYRSTRRAHHEVCSYHFLCRGAFELLRGSHRPDQSVNIRIGLHPSSSDRHSTRDDPLVWCSTHS